jgi:hypothetical protein
MGLRLVQQRVGFRRVGRIADLGRPRAFACKVNRDAVAHPIGRYHLVCRRIRHENPPIPAIRRTAAAGQYLNKPPASFKSGAL